MNVYRHGYNSPLPQNTDGRTEALGGAGAWSSLWCPLPSGSQVPLGLSLWDRILNPRSRVSLPLTL